VSERRTYKYYDLIMAAFVTTLLCSELIGVSKVSEIAGHPFGTGVLFFPINYLFGDILTEVYGYARSRRVVWAGFAALFFASLMSQAVLALPAAPTWSHQHELEVVFGSTPRIVLASLCAFFAGEFMNSFTLARLKVLSSGRWLWLRFIASTIMGEATDTIIFYPLAFFGQWPNELLATVMITNYFIKVIWEAVATPLTYVVVGWLKRTENEDFYDRETDFNPFTLKV
jgi:uncharacterized integral membrane protein (TIGR00697 family)